jgi:hypothetical protein
MAHMRSTLLASLLLTAAITGCTGTGTGTVQYSASGTYSSGELVEIEPGVQVVADYDEPVFYSDNYYWRLNAGVWYRSDDYRRRDWVRVDAPAPRVVHVQNPTMYVHFRGHANANAGGRGNDHRDDNRGGRPQPQAYQPPQPQPVAHPGHPQPQWTPPADKQDRKEVREEIKDDRRDAKEERKDDRRDAKEERKDDKRDAKEERKDDKRDAKEERKDDKRDKKNGR